MPGGRERALRGRIRSINSTKKITKAMELIAASRIVKAVARIAAARPYFQEASELGRELHVASGSAKGPLYAPDPEKPIAVIVVTADRGLCGSYNTSVLRMAESRYASGGVELVGIGRRGESYLRFRGIPTSQQLNQVTNYPTLAQAHRIMDPLIARVQEGELGGIEVISVRFVSMGTQRTETTTLVPVEFAGESEETERFDFEAEPSLEEVADEAAKILVVAEFFGLLLEASAAESAARQRAMKNATDNADELAKTLTRAMNRVRQDAITIEITEIVGGAEALKSAAVGDKEEQW